MFAPICSAFVTIREYLIFTGAGTFALLTKSESGIIALQTQVMAFVLVEAEAGNGYPSISVLSQL